MALQDYLNPNQGQLLGYVYRNQGIPDMVIDGIKLKQGPNESYYALPGTKPDYVSDGVSYVITRRGTDNEWAVPIAQPGTFESISVTPLPGATKIPIYEPPVNLSYGGKQLTDKEKFQLGASLAGAQDATPPKAVRASGALDSNYVSGELRSAMGLPKSFDMLANVNPTSSDWGLKQSTIWNPTSGGFFGDVTEALSGPMGKVAALAASIIGGPAAGKLVLDAGAASAAGAGEALAGDVLANLAAQEASQQAMGAAVANALGGAGGSIFTDAVVNKALNQALQGALTSGAISGGTAALTGGDPLKAALQGAVSGGLSGGISGLAAPVVEQLGLPTSAGSALTGAITGAGRAALTGGDVLRGALTGGVTSGIGSLVQQIPGMESLPENARNAIASGLASAAGAALTGGASPLLSAIAGGMAGLATPTQQRPAAGAIQPTQQPAQQAGGMQDLLSIMALSKAQQPQQAPQQAQAVGPINPYEFSDNLLEGIYQSRPTSVYGANEELLRLARGQK